MMLLKTIQTPYADLSAEKNDSRLLTNAAVQKNGGHSIHIFLKSYNPFNWFNDFSNIHITLEEFADNKK